MVQEPLLVVPLAPLEHRVLSVGREFGKQRPPTFSRDTDLVEVKLWLKWIVCIFEHIELVEDHLYIDAATF